MRYYLPWNSISSIWSAASQIWSEAWYEEVPTPPEVDTDKLGGGASDNKTQNIWANWLENQKRKKYKRKIEMSCIVNGLEFKSEKDSSEEVTIGFKVNSVSFSETPKNSELQLENIQLEVR